MEVNEFRKAISLIKDSLENLENLVDVDVANNSDKLMFDLGVIFADLSRVKKILENG
jgi:hypothetical protein